MIHTNDTVFAKKKKRNPHNSLTVTKGKDRMSPFHTVREWVLGTKSDITNEYILSG